MNSITCGCRYYVVVDSCPKTRYLPQSDVSAHTVIDSTVYQTTLTQKYGNPSKTEIIKECTYVFPIFEGVSVIKFTCTVGSRVIKGVVKEKLEARKVYDTAVERGETAGLLEQGSTGDVFAIKLGNIPAGESLQVDIVYVGELKHDAGLNGIRYTLPTFISPRYGNEQPTANLLQDSASGISVTVDINMPVESPVQTVRSPSHPIELKLGSTSTSNDNVARPSQASATLALSSAALDKDFVLEVMYKDNGQPKALLEQLDGITGQRALMVTLLPQLLAARGPPPELIIVADQSGSMQGARTRILVSALRILLKSLPVNVIFNICAFGSSHKLLWDKSQQYDEKRLKEAMKFVDNFSGDFGGTETFSAVRAAINSRDMERNLAVILATDGDIWGQENLFQYLNEQVAESKTFVRVFPLGIGNSVSSSLTEGVARAGNGFSQTVAEGEKQDVKVIRMLKGALTPDTGSWAMEISFKQEDDDFVLVERVTDSLRVLGIDEDINDVVPSKESDGSMEINRPAEEEPASATLPKVSLPKLLQAPQIVPPLYPQSRRTLYMLLSPDLADKVPESLTIRNSSSINPFKLTIPIEQLPSPGTTLHSLAAKRAILELEEGRGWLKYALDTTNDNKLLKQTHASIFSDIVEAECVRLGEQYQLAGKYTSFIAVESNDTSTRSDSTTRFDETTTSMPNGYVPTPENLASVPVEQSVASVASAISYYSGPPSPPRMMKKRACCSARGPSFTAKAKCAITPSSAISTFSRSGDGDGSGKGSWMKGFAAKVSGRNRSNQSARSSVGGQPPRMQLASAAAPSPPPPENEREGVEDDEGSEESYSGQMSVKRSAKARTAAAPTYQGKKVGDDDGTLDQIIAMEKFEGSWELSDRLLKILRMGSAAKKVPKGVEDEVWATLLVILFLEKKMMHEKETWEMVAEKAKTWLEGQGVVFAEEDGVCEQARTVICGSE